MAAVEFEFSLHPTEADAIEPKAFFQVHEAAGVQIAFDWTWDLFFPRDHHLNAYGSALFARALLAALAG